MSTINPIVLNNRAIGIVQVEALHNISKRTPKSFRKSEALLSKDCPVSSDVRGNLGAADVITNESVQDWLKDRWQAAKSMAGDPIPGPHWVEIDLRRPCYIKRFILDWETGFSSDYSIFAKIQPLGQDYFLIGSSSAITINSYKQHIVHELKLKPSHSDPPYFQHVRLLINKPATQWGVSLWRFQIYGYE